MKTRLAAVVAVLLVAGLAGTAQAGVVIDVTQVGPNVEATLSGTLDLTDLVLYKTTTASGASVDPSIALLSTGLDAGGIADFYSGISGPISFGTGAFAPGTSGAGDFAGVAGTDGVLHVTAGYVSGQTLSGNAYFDGTTIASLGLMPGSYVYTWGTGAHADSLTVNIMGAAVPEPSSLAMLGVAVAADWVVSRRRRSR